jgi:hypothetical protein
MGKLVLAILLAGARLLEPTPPASLPTVIDIRPVSGESVVIRVAGGDGILFKANMPGIKRQGMRLTELTAPGTLEITGGDGTMELSSVDGTSSFVLSVQSNAGRRTRVLEALGEHATIRVLAGSVEIEAARMSMREVRAP